MWRPARWANWMFEIGKYDEDTGNFTFGKGGNQGARGSNSGGDFFIENVSTSRPHTRPHPGRPPPHTTPFHAPPMPQHGGASSPRLKSAHAPQKRKAAATLAPARPSSAVMTVTAVTGDGGARLAGRVLL